MPQRAAATKLICGCSEEEERARARPTDKERPERCPRYARAVRRRRRRHRVLPRFCECVNPQPPPPPPPPPPALSPSRCHLCGGPLLSASVCSGDADRPAERIIQCPCERPGSSELDIPPAKRDQGVLAKLPKPERKKKKEKRLVRDTLEVLLDRSTRKAEQLIQSLKYGLPNFENHRYTDSSHDGCTCPRNSCNC